MKNLAGLFLSLMIVAVLAACGDSSKKATSSAGEVAEASNAAVSYAIEGSSLGWLAKKVTGQHNGSINVSNGEIKVESGAITAGNFTIDMKTITVLDIPADNENNGKLAGHLNSPDFFNTDSFPTADFAITKVTALENNPDANHIVYGNLTIKGITQEISFPAMVSIADDALTAKAVFSIDRTLWDIRYGSGKFFEDLGDKTIYDEFELTVDLNAKRSSMAMN
ncbi:MAG: YceI family protein [Bacteroidota bacterium]